MKFYMKSFREIQRWLKSPPFTEFGDWVKACPRLHYCELCEHWHWRTPPLITGCACKEMLGMKHCDQCNYWHLGSKCACMIDDIPDATAEITPATPIATLYWRLEHDPDFSPALSLKTKLRLLLYGLVESWK